MNGQHADTPPGGHRHVFLGAYHAQSERRTWAAISLTMFMMIAEIAGGGFYGSLAVVADGFHMATHSLVLLVAALAYSYARWHAEDPRFVFGTGKLGDLSGFASAVVLLMIALMIGFVAATRLFAPVVIHYDQAILIAFAGLIVNVATAWLLGSGGHPGPAHRHGHAQSLDLHRSGLDREAMHHVDLVEHPHSGESSTAAVSQDYNLRAAFVHVTADAAVSVLAIFGLLVGRFFGWVWMDPIMGIAGAAVIANWAYGLMRDTGAILLDMNPDKAMTEELRRVIESGGDRLADLHLWRLGPGHLGAIFSIVTAAPRDADFYRSKLARFPILSHITIEVRRMEQKSKLQAFGHDLIQKLVRFHLF